MNKLRGFTFIEVIILLVVMGILGSTFILGLTTASRMSPNVLPDMIAEQTAKQCMEWFIGQRRLVGYSSITCPSSTVPAFCVAPTGYTVTVNITCTTINTDANYQTIAVTSTGGNNGKAVFTTIIANY